jgi:HYR domain
MQSLPKRISHPAALPAFVIAFLVIIAALAGPLFTRSEAAPAGGAQSKQSARESDSPTLSIGEIKIMRADGARAAGAQGDMAVISITSGGWQPGETVEVSIYRPGAGLIDAAFNLVADKKGRIIKTNLMLYSATDGLKYMNAVGRESGRYVTGKFEINGDPLANVNTYDATCTTGDSDFVLGETVCAQVTGINPKTFNARFDWVDPDGIIQEMGPTIVADGQTDTFMIPAMGPNAKIGLWQVRITNQNDDSTIASVGFNVTAGGPQEEAIATFSSDCETPQSSFVGGVTVCAKVTGIDAGEENTFRIDWIRPDNSVAENGPIVTMNNQTDTFTIPSGGPAGTWTVQLTRLSDGEAPASASFDVTVFDCTIICPDSTTVSNDPNDCGAVVNYAQPFTKGDCGKVTCSPPPGSRFVVGTTTVTCDASNTKATPDCSFTVTVIDTQAPTVMCSKGVSQPAGPGMCSAVVNYTVPTATDNCPCGPKGSTSCPVMCSPPPGSIFMVGMTTVVCMATDAAGNKGSCSFAVTVTDTQPPTITCPQPITVVTPQTCPPASSIAVTFVTPSVAGGTVSDNCSVTVMCSPASGSIFPVGTTTVTCTATDVAGNTASCSFTVTAFNACLQDDARPGQVILFNTFTGEYRFCCGATVRLAGRGSIIQQGCVFTLQHNASDRRVFAKIDFSVRRGNASLQNLAGPSCTISDTNIRDNSCQCAAPPHTKFG